MKMNSSNPAAVLGITVTEVPAEKRFYQQRASVPALDSLRSPLASERIQILEAHHKQVRGQLDRLAKVEQGIVDVVGALHAYDAHLCEQGRAHFVVPEMFKMSARDCDLGHRFIAEGLLLITKVHRGASSLTEVFKKDPSAKEMIQGVSVRCGESSSSDSTNALFKQVAAAQRKKESLFDVVSRETRLAELRLKALADSLDDDATSALVKDFSLEVSELIAAVQEKPLKKVLRGGAEGLSWYRGVLSPEGLERVCRKACTVVEVLRAKVQDSLPILSDEGPRLARAAAKALNREPLRLSAGLREEELAILTYAVSRFPSERDISPGDMPTGLADTAAGRFRELEFKLGAEHMRSIVDSLELDGAKGRTWLSTWQANSLRGVLDTISTEREAQKRASVYQNLFISEPEVASVPQEEPVVVLAAPSVSSIEYLREIFGPDVVQVVEEKLGELPPVEQVEARTIALEDVAGFALASQGADPGFALVSKMLATNPHLLTMPNFEEYCVDLRRAIARIDKLKLSKPMYDIVASTQRFSGPSALAETVACIERASSYRSVVSALDEAGLKGDAVMAVLQYGFFFQGRLQFGPRVGEDRMIYENVDRQSPQRFLPKDLEKGLAALQQAGVIARASRAQGAFLSREVTPGAKHAQPISKAMAWVISNPDPRVEF